MRHYIYRERERSSCESTVPAYALRGTQTYRLPRKGVRTPVRDISLSKRRRNRGQERTVLLCMQGARQGHHHVNSLRQQRIAFRPRRQAGVIEMSVVSPQVCQLRQETEPLLRDGPSGLRENVKKE